MTRLWVRLSIAFGAVVFISFMVIGAITVSIIRANLREVNETRSTQANQPIEAIAPDQVERPDAFISIVADEEIFVYLEGIGNALSAVYESELPRLLGYFQLLNSEEFSRIVAAVVDEFTEARSTQGQTVAGSAPETERNNAFIPVLVNGETVAYLDRPETDAPPGPGPFGIIPLLNSEQFFLMVAAVVGSLAVLFGVLISRMFVASLNALAVTADAIGAGEWDRRVQVKGTTEVQSLAQSFNKMIDQLQNNERLRRNLVADVAHELRTPITALQANIYAILDDAYPMTKDEIAGLYEQTRMLSRLVKDLHELSQADAGMLPLDCRLVDFSDTLGELIAPFRMVAESKGVELKVEIPPNLLPVNVDEERINQVIHNLLNNALRHTPSGGTITIRVRQTADTLCLEVQDTGEGIAAEHLPNVFERFYRAEYARSRKTGGMGLGLAIAKAIVEAHNGRISASSTGVNGEGSTFVVQLPVTG